MDKVEKLIPKNVVRLIPKEPVILEPKVTVDFEIEFIDNTGDVIMDDD